MRTRAARVTSAAGRPWTSRFPYKKLLHMPGSVDHAGSSRRSLMARPCVWPSTFGTVSAPGMIGLSRSMAGLCTPLPTLRRRLAGVCARLGASAGRYSFTVRDFHPLLLAGLPAHSEKPAQSRSLPQQSVRLLHAIRPRGRSRHLAVLAQPVQGLMLTEAAQFEMADFNDRCRNFGGKAPVMSSGRPHPCRGVPAG